MPTTRSVNNEKSEYLITKTGLPDVQIWILNHNFKIFSIIISCPLYNPRFFLFLIFDFDMWYLFDFGLVGFTGISEITQPCNRTLGHMDSGPMDGETFRLDLISPDETRKNGIWFDSMWESTKTMWWKK